MGHDFILLGSCAQLFVSTWEARYTTLFERSISFFFASFLSWLRAWFWLCSKHAHTSFANLNGYRNMVLPARLRARWRCWSRRRAKSMAEQQVAAKSIKQIADFILKKKGKIRIWTRFLLVWSVKLPWNVGGLAVRFCYGELCEVNPFLDAGLGCHYITPCRLRGGARVWGGVRLAARKVRVRRGGGTSSSSFVFFIIWLGLCLFLHPLSMATTTSGLCQVVNMFWNQAVTSEPKKKRCKSPWDYSVLVVNPSIIS